MATEIFRSYDIRGIVGKNLNEDVAKNIGKAFGTYLQGEEDVVVGMDMRVSSESLKKFFISGLTSTGCNIIDIGMVATPIVYFAIIFLEKNAGACVTASHNPPEWNGFKLRGKNAVGLSYDKELKEIEKIFLSKKFLKSKNGIITQKEMRKAYVNKMTSKIKIERKLKVVLDIGNGMGGIAETIYRNLGCDVISLYKEPNGRFPHHIADPSLPETLEKLQKKVVSEKADIGIAFDGDCDRVGFVDNRGRIVSNDVVFSIFARHVLNKNKNASVICDIRTPMNVIKEIERLGGNVIITKAGSVYVMNKLIETNGVLAGEMSGHFWLGNEWFNIDDAIFSGAKMLEIISSSKNSFARIVDEIPKSYFIPSKKIPCPDEKKEKVMKKLIDKLEKKYSVLKIDGAKIIEDDWSILIRPSRTEPKIEFVVESKKNDVNKIYKNFEKIVKDLLKSRS